MDRTLRSALTTAALTAALILGTGALALAAPVPGRPPVRLAFAGDIMLGRSVAAAHALDDWQTALDPLAPYLGSADLALANLESPLTAAPLVKPTLDLRGPADAAEALHAAGLRVVTLGNNHSLDAGLPGLADTQRALMAAGITDVVPGPLPWLVTLRGTRVAVVAYDGTGVPPDEQTLLDRTAVARQAADIVIVSIHWGMELNTAPEPAQRSLAARLAASGADIIIGHHPHVLQPVEWIWGAGRGRPTLVAYSLGNALFDQGAPPGARTGALLLATASAAGIQQACLVPFRIVPGAWDVAMADATTADVVRRATRWPCVLGP
jgi:poly-gamma-glutamate synthesis protein (capsule biosynthesis protein)